MGVSIEVWRACIGLHNTESFSLCSRPLNRVSYLEHALAALVILLLLLIGNIELNPGPFCCHYCHAEHNSLSALLKHQSYHANDRNFIFHCPQENCFYRTRTLTAVKFHVSQFHRHEQCVDTRDQDLLYCNAVDCRHTENSVWLLVQHLYTHLDSGVTVSCPLVCDFQKCFAKKSVFQSHLSQYHPGWKGNACPNESVKMPPPSTSRSSNFEEDAYYDCIDDEEEKDPIVEESDLLNDHLILNTIAKFYLKLYAEKRLAYDTVQEISIGLSFLLEVNHARMKLLLLRELKSSDVPDDRANLICFKVSNSDLLYTSHQKSASGPSFTSTHLRKEYFRTNLSLVKAKALNLGEPHETDKELQYVSIEKTLDALLQDPSIQKEVEESFCRQPDNADVISNYTDGTLFKLEDHGQKEIHLLLYQDSFNAVMNALGSAKNKYKELVVYFTIGNLKAHLRAQIDTKNLVMIVRESVFKLVGAAKAFKHLKEELTKLERNGMRYKGETLKVVVQCILGDNLGQHIVGGFTESFSGKYFCRFCEITRSAFKLHPSTSFPPRSKEEYNRCLLRAQMTDEITKGVKCESAFSGLKYFHPTSHLPPCIAHDLFEGVVSWDFSGIIASFVAMKWFTYELLNERIKRFQCKGKDIPNKPAQVHTSGEKLGGHAIQNWTLLRLFFFIVGDKIQDFNDPSWCLYLQLKVLCEFFTSPSFRKTDLPYIKDVLLPLYFDQRSRTLDEAKYPLKPKHHFMCHYPELILKFGPLIHLWTLSYEQKHKYFKEAVRVGKNFINLEHSLAERYQMSFCYLRSGMLVSEGCADSDSVLVSLKVYEEPLATFIKELNLPASARHSEVAEFNTITYKKNDVLLLSKDTGVVQIGIIEAIIVDMNSANFILECLNAAFVLHQGIYSAPLDAVGQHKLYAPWDIKYPVPHPVYYHNGRLSFSLKHNLI